ncbi:MULTISPECIES: hypothetical protein [unclassified Paenibacillus]|uniref:hypothetical protein n=1 Tax=unclassified Paenibacillus TaxID=185978 RepID=UPI002118B63D|nr:MULTISPECIES: hypothetical protein [unclassified Paenibacillus]
MEDNMKQSSELINALVQTNMERFFTYGFLSPQWWLLLAFLVVPWLIWFKIADRKRMLDIMAVGMLVAMATKLLDLVGYNLGLAEQD